MDEKEIRLPRGTDVGSGAASTMPFPAASRALSSALHGLRVAVIALVRLEADRKTDFAPSEVRGAAVARLRHAIQLVCQDAHAQGLQAEQLVILVKQECGAFADAVPIRGRRGQLVTLNRIVTACIDEFYAFIPTGRPVSFEPRRRAQ